MHTACFGPTLINAIREHAEVQQGEILSLLGPNGAGKSTAISMLSCLSKPTSGEAWVMNHSVTREPMAVKSLIGVVPQDLALYPDLSARENLTFWGRMYGLKGAALAGRADQVMEIIELEQRKETVGTFSGGMKRRVNIGIALMNHPQVPKTNQAKNADIFQLKVTIRGSRPPIWRRLQLPADMRLDKLHAVLQAAFAWTDYHLHQFMVGDDYYGVPDPEFGDRDIHDEKKFRLNQLVGQPKDKLVYEYDFGDSWIHEITLEKILAAEPGVRYPICVTGKRAAPPEDCGGVWGYENLLHIIQDPKHEDYETMLTWLGGPIAPEAFNVDAVNKELGRVR